MARTPKPVRRRIKLRESKFRKHGPNWANAAKVASTIDWRRSGKTGLSMAIVENALYEW